MPILLEDPPIRQLTPKHHVAIALKFQGKEYKDIAKELSVSVDTLRHWFVHNGILAQEYSRYVARVMNPKPIANHTDSVTVADRIKELAPAAINKLGSLINSSRDQVALQASDSILDRAGYMPIQKLVNVHMVEEMTITELDSYVTGILGKVKPSTLPIYKEEDSETTINVPDLSAITELIELDPQDDETIAGVH